MCVEIKRLEENEKRVKHWKKWGPYISERQWGTVREDYSEDGDAWAYFDFNQSHSRAYRWGEDGIAGISDNHQKLCFALSFWNGKDEILKERIFGLSNVQGNHGEDVKDYFYYLDSTPTHSYMKYLYKYPQSKFPYEDLIKENAKRDQDDREYELIDTGVFDNDEYFDVFIEYAKEDVEDLFIYVTVHNRAKEEKEIHVLPTIWFRNTWAWESDVQRPHLKVGMSGKDYASVVCEKKDIGEYVLYGETPDEILFTDNETNNNKLFNSENKSAHVKDAFHEYIIRDDKEAVNKNLQGTKAAFVYKLTIPPGDSKRVTLRLSDENAQRKPLADARKIYKARFDEANQFYDELLPKDLSNEHKMIERQAISGMLWSKQFYHYVVQDWIHGDKAVFTEKLIRKNPRNQNWPHIYNDDILSMPDKWEYPWFAAWDLAFHTLVLAMVDPEFAKRQLTLLTREWYMHPNGQLPAYEWNFDDVNPPVHAWAAWRVYKIEHKRRGREDQHFLESVFQKLLLNFTWWVNREDEGGRNVFKGGFLGLDNISVFNRSEHIPEGGELYQSDATSWMGMFCLNMLTIALELAQTNPAYEDMASKFYEHFLYIAEAINYEDEAAPSLWDEEDGFYYDILAMPDGQINRLKVKSLVGLIPLFAVSTVDAEVLERFPGYNKRVNWFIKHRDDLCTKVACMRTPGVDGRRILAIVNREKLSKILKIMLDESEFLSPYGIRSIALSHKEDPFELRLNSHKYCVDYEPGESTNRLFGGNSNWRGPIWMPVNILIIESLQKFHHYYGDDFKVECPTGSGNMMNLWEVSQEISRRLINIYTQDSEGFRAVFKGKEKFEKDPNFKDYLFFHEYFHGDTGEGIGASHQTGWTGLIAKLIQQLGEHGGFIL
ncbi:MAG: hypothetical protein S4CHLAM37_10420 [Chlamydiia bacterium]|nr:hypothetical protein [Chlamydiia bacterium]